MSVNVLKHQLDFVWSVRIKHLFRDNSFANTSQYRKMFVKSEWIPPRCPPWIKFPLLAIRAELYSLHNRHNHYSFNLSCSELLTLCRLRSLTGIRILAADKNLGPTIITNYCYHKEVSRLLSASTYRKVEAVPFTFMKNKLISILERYGNSIGDKLKLIFFNMQTSTHLLTSYSFLKYINVHWL